MTLTHGQLNDLTDTIDKLRQTVAHKGHELVRRAAIPTHDGYPKRASGSQGGTSGPATMVDVRWDTTDCAWFLFIGERRQGPYTSEHDAWGDAPSRTISYSDPTGEAALASTASKDPVANRARTMLRALDDAIGALQRAVNQLDDRGGTDDGGPWCDSCQRHHGPDGKPSLSPPDPKVKGRTDVNGRLKDPMWLCRWCADWTRDTGQLPDRSTLKQHLERGKARVPA